MAAIKPKKLTKKAEIAAHQAPFLTARAETEARQAAQQGAIELRRAEHILEADSILARSAPFVTSTIPLTSRQMSDTVGPLFLEGRRLFEKMTSDVAASRPSADAAVKLQTLFLQLAKKCISQSWAFDYVRKQSNNPDKPVAIPAYAHLQDNQKGRPGGDRTAKRTGRSDFPKGGIHGITTALDTSLDGIARTAQRSVQLADERARLIKETLEKQAANKSKKKRKLVVVHEEVVVQEDVGLEDGETIEELTNKLVARLEKRKRHRVIDGTFDPAMSSFLGVFLSTDGNSAHYCLNAPMDNNILRIIVADCGPTTLELDNTSFKRRTGEKHKTFKKDA